MFIEFVFKLVVACSFLVARVIKKHPEEAHSSHRKCVLTENKHASPECAI